MSQHVPILKLPGLFFVAVSLAMGGAACKAVAAQPTTVALVAMATVRIANFTFTQQTLTVRPGTTVTWVNDDDIPHAIVSKTLAFKSKVLDAGDRFTFTFAKAGEFGYFCSLHPHMTGTIIVKA